MTARWRDQVVRDLTAVGDFPVRALAAHGVVSGLPRGEALRRAHVVVGAHADDEPTLESLVDLMNEVTAIAPPVRDGAAREVGWFLMDVPEPHPNVVGDCVVKVEVLETNTCDMRAVVSQDGAVVWEGAWVAASVGTVILGVMPPAVTRGLRFVPGVGGAGAAGVSVKVEAR